LATPPRAAAVARPPILVTGVPRSGTTWLARALATADRVALAGREPMNPRGKQYALAHTLNGWTRLERPSTRQRWALRTAYRGINPWLYSRYGRRQWAAPLPWTRLVVKDPFAMLSLPAVASVTGARVVLLYRHPGAILASYRRMGWQPDVDELLPIVEQLRTRGSAGDPFWVAPSDLDLSRPPNAMGWFWGVLCATALADLSAFPGSLVVSHEEVATGGPEALARLFQALGLSATRATDLEYGEHAAPGQGTGARRLHNFDRSPTQVANAWRDKLGEGELELIEATTATVRERLDAARLPLGPPEERQS
jgi:sulfotransferase family protein